MLCPPDPLGQRFLLPDTLRWGSCLLNWLEWRSYLLYPQIAVLPPHHCGTEVRPLRALESLATMACLDQLTVALYLGPPHAGWDPWPAALWGRVHTCSTTGHPLRSGWKQTCLHSSCTLHTAKKGVALIPPKCATCALQRGSHCGLFHTQACRSHT